MIDFSNVTGITIPEGRVRVIQIGGVQMWKGSALNLVTTSIDTDGSIYNGTGYMEDYRLNSSGVVTAQSDAIHSGFIPYTWGGVIRAAGSTATIGVSGHYIAFYDESFTCVKSITSSSVATSSGTYGSYSQRDDGTYLLTVINLDTFFEVNYPDIDTSTIKYVRVSMPVCKGDDFIVTIDEEIV